ncbi:MAG: response regulator, partial [Cetobacterium sp.]
AIKKFHDKNMLFNEEKIGQEDLDKLNFIKKENLEILPKGLNEKTLNGIMNKIDSLEGKEFNIKEICELTEMSNVTIKKYLDYLEKIDYIKENITYGNIGRPQYVYKKL